MKRTLSLLTALCLLLTAAVSLAEEAAPVQMPYLPGVTGLTSLAELEAISGQKGKTEDVAGMKITIFQQLTAGDLNRYYDLVRVGDMSGGEGAAMYIYEFDLIHVPSIWKFTTAEQTRQAIPQDIERMYAGHLTALDITTRDMKDNARDSLREKLGQDQSLIFKVNMVDSMLESSILLGSNYEDGIQDFHCWQTDGGDVIACAYSGLARNINRYYLLVMPQLSNTPGLTQDGQAIPSLIRGVSLGQTREEIQAVLDQDKTNAMYFPDEDGALMVILGKPYSFFGEAAIGQLSFDGNGKPGMIILMYYPDDLSMYESAVQQVPDIFPFEMLEYGINEDSSMLSTLQQGLSSTVTESRAWMGGGMVVLLAKDPVEGVVFAMQISLNMLNN